MDEDWEIYRVSDYGYQYITANLKENEDWKYLYHTLNTTNTEIRSTKWLYVKKDPMLLLLLKVSGLPPIESIWK